MYPTEKIEERVWEKVKEPLSIAHGFDHLKRTATGAKWFARLLGGGQEEQEKAYLSGLVHDIHRPPSSTAHDESLSLDYEKAKTLLEEFNLDEETVKEIALPIKEHRELSEKKGIICQSLFLADKILENMGAMIVFRRNMYIGENPIYVNVPLREATVKQYERRLNKFKPSDFPQRFRPLAEYQYNWPAQYLTAYKSHEEWTVHLNQYCYEKGKQKSEFIQTVEEFQPKTVKGKEYKEEALQYIKGGKFKFFESLIK